MNPNTLGKYKAQGAKLIAWIAGGMHVLTPDGAAIHVTIYNRFAEDVSAYFLAYVGF